MQNFKGGIPNTGVHPSFKKSTRASLRNRTEKTELVRKLAVATTKGAKTKVTLPTLKFMEGA